MAHPLASEPNLVFIGGTGRCGTNLLKDVFALHRDVATLPFEYRFIIDPDGIVDFYNTMTTSWSPFVADVKIRRLEDFLNTVAKKNVLSHPFNVLLRGLNRSGKKISIKKYHHWELAKWIPNFQEHVNGLMKQLVQFDFSGSWPGTVSYAVNNRVCFASSERLQLTRQLGGFVSACIADYLKQNNCNYFVEDNTWNILFAPQLFELLPGMKLIHIIRDPRDVTASFIKQRWCPTKLESAIKFYRSIMERWLTIKPTLPVHRYLEIRFEQLITDRETVLKQCCEFAGFDIDKQMYTMDFSKNNIGRWQQDLSEDQQKQLEEGVSNILHQLNYNRFF